MNKYAFIIDVKKCENCNNCFLSCKDEHCGNEWPGYAAPQPVHGHRWMNIRRRERGSFPMIDVAYRPTPCMHCDDPPCLKAAENGAVVKREDGIILILPEKAKGQKTLVASCPYDAIWWTEDLQLPQKCSFCAHLIDDGWKEPRCVQSCPTGALKFYIGNDEQLQQCAIDENLQPLSTESGEDTQPRCYYKNVHRFDSSFIAGSIARNRDGVEDCVEGVSVLLRQDGKIIAEAVSDDFGDFRFDGLEQNSGAYKVELMSEERGAQAIQVELAASINLGTIMI